MTLETVRATIDSERSLLLPLHEKVTSRYFKLQCRNALNCLNDWEYFFFGGGLKNPEHYLEQAKLFSEIVVNQRKAVEDAVSKYGADAIVAPDDLR